MLDRPPMTPRTYVVLGDKIQKSTADGDHNEDLANGSL
jgi:hypothetical protein